MKRGIAILAAALALAFLSAALGAPARNGPREQASAQTAAIWSFAVSGDSRNYGDVIMPAIAAGVLKHHPKFYWHLGDFRRGYQDDKTSADEDILNQREHAGKTFTLAQYLDLEWPDFLEHQVKPFGSLPVYLGIGNHDTIKPKTRDAFVAAFGAYLGPGGGRKTYYHWIIGGVDFINLDNATEDQFEDAQVRWFKQVLYEDTEGRGSSGIKSIVVGMHRALPDSKSAGHSMNESEQMASSGRRIYRELLTAQNEAHKNVYILASHSHFYMENVYDTKCWEGGVIPGWIVGTAGAQHYKLPEGIAAGPGARTKNDDGSNVYGYLLGTVAADSKVTFAFQQVSFDDVRKAVGERYAEEFVRQAFTDNYTERVDVHQAVCPVKP